MKFQRVLGVAFGALTLSVTLLAAASPVTAADGEKCHDETTMYIGRLVDGKCLRPDAPLTETSFDRDSGAVAAIAAESDSVHAAGDGTAQVQAGSSVQR